MTADARRGGSGWRARGRKRRRTENFPGTRLAPVSMSRAWGRARRPGGIGTPRGGGNAQGGNRAVCPQSGENSDGLIPFSGEPRRTVAPLFSALVPAMDATLAIMAARPLYCALPEGLMTTHQRAREVAAEVARHEKTRLFLNDREIWRAVPAGGHTCETTPPGTSLAPSREIQKAKPSTTTATTSRKTDRPFRRFYHTRHSNDTLPDPKRSGRRETLFSASTRAGSRRVATRGFVGAARWRAARPSAPPPPAPFWSRTAVPPNTAPTPWTCRARAT